MILAALYLGYKGIQIQHPTVRQNLGSVSPSQSTLPPFLLLFIFCLYPLKKKNLLETFNALDAVPVLCVQWGLLKETKGLALLKFLS